MNLYLDERRIRHLLFPFTHIRNVADIRVGILTIREKWEILLREDHPVITTEHPLSDSIIVPANIIPTKDNYRQILSSAKKEEEWSVTEDIKYIDHPWNIFQFNDWALRKDFELLTHNRKSSTIPDIVHCVNKKDIFIEEGAIIHFSSLNAEAGPVYIGKNTLIMEGALIRGPFSLGEKSVVKMGAKIYGATTTGVHCVLGGEIKNSVFFDYSNKAHDGYLGDSVIGSWCNLAAGTTNSNVKNNSSEVYFSSPSGKSSVSAGTKAGLLMGDYSKTSVNTAFHTGSVVGICSNVFGNVVPDKHIPNFSWGSERYHSDKLIRDIGNWKKMKQKEITQEEINMINTLYNQL
ncbi:MAG: glucose-1-phosphate thymidylyltransferase [Ferruginibacter sp.]|nr:glucose-1-phosphate thymidylyltransferase [Ferruginibacter sp.]